MRRPSLTDRILPLAVVALAACADSGPVAPPGPAPAEEPVLARLECTADVQAGAVRCAGADAALPAGVQGDLVLGWQRVTVRMISSGASYDGSAFFTVNVNVQNLLGQPIGTTDGVTEEEIRVFFTDEPITTGGTGTVTVDNEDGSAMFMGAPQPYHAYGGILATEETSAAKEWRFAMPNTVLRFAFTVYVSAPVPDEDALNAIDLDPRTLAVGGYHGCALTTGGEGYCWGTNDDGQMGSAAADSVPRVIDGQHSWRALTAGRYHTCGVTTEGDGYCWGDNQTGQVGYGGEDDSNVPLLVAGGHEWVMIDAGAGHTCGVTVQMDAYCWGDGSAGQLGGGDSVAVAGTPVLVTGGRKWATVDAGKDHSCGVTRGGAAWCWGDDTDGELGTGAASTARPALVVGDRSWRHVSAGESYTCGITSLGTAMCWGLDSAGQIGNGAAGGPDTPAEVAGGQQWLRITAGRETSCGITTASTAYCWGFNNTGEIGDGTTTFRDVPEPVSGGLLWGAIDGGDYHTCGITQAGDARCWGYNAQGQLGDNSLENRPNPTLVAGGHVWAQ
jgi:alpha-tubulin suppressor-like RCC1 family protein